MLIGSLPAFFTQASHFLNALIAGLYCPLRSGIQVAVSPRWFKRGGGPLCQWIGRLYIIMTVNQAVVRRELRAIGQKPVDARRLE